MDSAQTRRNAGRILVVDDSPDVLTALRLLLSGEGFAVVSQHSPGDALAVVRTESFDAALIDLNYARDTTSGREGLTLLEVLRNADPTLPVAVMTAWGTVGAAVEAMRLGSWDYVEKPWNDEQLVAMLTAMTIAARARRQVGGRSPDAGTNTLIGESSEIHHLRDVLRRVATSRATVLITGAHGSGKEVVARLLHEQSDRASQPFVALNAGGLSPGVAESELFGHVRGAFTDARSDRVGCFELASGGTLFLDEIGNMPSSLQAKLLRALEASEIQRVGASRPVRVDVRVVAATNADLPAEVRSGNFREDLLYRLNTVEISVPSLRQRGPRDIMLLAAHFLARFVSQYKREISGFSPAAVEVLTSHAWPGNVRELAHTVERGVLLATGGFISPDNLGLRSGSAVEARNELLESDCVTRLDELERRHIKRVLDQANGNVETAANLLGLSRSALYRRLKPDTET